MFFNLKKTSGFDEKETGGAGLASGWDNFYHGRTMDNRALTVRLIANRGAARDRATLAVIAGVRLPRPAAGEEIVLYLIRLTASTRLGCPGMAGTGSGISAAAPAGRQPAIWIIALKDGRVYVPMLFTIVSANCSDQGQVLGHSP